MTPSEAHGPPRSRKGCGGPKTREGKARSSQNARRHGFSRPALLADPQDARAKALVARLGLETGPKDGAVALQAVALRDQIHALIRHEIALVAEEVRRIAANEPDLPKALAHGQAIANLASQLATLQGYRRKATSKWRRFLKDTGFGTPAPQADGGPGEL